MKIQIISSVILISFCILTFVQVEGWDDKVLLEKVRALTLYRGKYTTGRRHKPIKQIECVGGDAGCRYEPDVIQCRNIGSDGINPNWKCEADLPKSLKFGRLKVTCEGYEHPNDQNVLKGSCGLKYTLFLTNDHTSDRKRKQWFNNWFDDEKRNDNFKVDDETESLFGTLFTIAWIGMVGYILYNMYLTYMRTRREDNRPTNFPDQGFRSSDYGDGDVPRHNPDFSSSTSRAYRRENIPNPGFWTGVLGGGLFGYLFARRNNNINNYSRIRRRRREASPSYSSSSSYFTRNDYDWNNDHSDYSSHTTTTSYDDDTYTAYGFAETDNR